MLSDKVWYSVWAVAFVVAVIGGILAIVGGVVMEHGRAVGGIMMLVSVGVLVLLVVADFVDDWLVRRRM